MEDRIRAKNGSYEVEDEYDDVSLECRNAVDDLVKTHAEEIKGTEVMGKEVKISPRTNRNKDKIAHKFTQVLEACNNGDK